eukprot:scaffold14810_cov48-Phaeocystis_antarctica.AAC.2
MSAVLPAVSAAFTPMPGASVSSPLSAAVFPPTAAYSSCASSPFSTCSPQPVLTPAGETGCAAPTPTQVCTLDMAALRFCSPRTAAVQNLQPSYGVVTIGLIAVVN